jgi:phage terminase large subunit
MILNHDIYTPLYLNKDKFIILVTGGRGCERPTQEIIMADLSVKQLKDVRVGDMVLGDDGTPRKVLQTHKGYGQMYEVTQSNGETYYVNDNHILTLYDNGGLKDVRVGYAPNKCFGARLSDPLNGDFSLIKTEMTITPIDKEEWCGISLDGNQRYVHSDGTITHNSGKSFALSTFIERLTFELGRDTTGHKIAHQILYSRYTMVSANISIIPEVYDKIEADGTQKYFARSKSDIINVKTGSKIMFRGIKTSSGNQTAKLKSIKGLSVFVCDEAEEFVNEKDFETIVYSIRQSGLKNLVIIIMNPTDSNHFIYQRYIKDTHKLVKYDGFDVQISTHPNVLHIHTSYLDNLEHLAPQFIEEAKAMKERDPERYAHIFMGRWADVAEGAIFKKWGVVKEFPDYCKKVYLGMDLGYSQDVTAIVKVGFVDNRIYMEELCYKTAMLSSDIIKELRKYPYHVISESADPRLIDEIALGGIIIYPVQKGPGSIMAGIDKMQTMELYVTEKSLNLQEELRNYTWDTDKNGNYINSPIDAYNHLIDAVRYVVLAIVLGKVMKPKNVTKERLGIF